jgi:formylglycine-generating enzyme required for sulfatase activity
MRCPTCGFENSGTAKFCAECGARIAPASSSAQIPGAELSFQPTLGAAPAADSPASIPSAESLIADRYRVQRTLGQGGMGAVYLATDTKPGMGGRGVAIKRILDADDQGVQRFLRESETIATLNHQNIRAVYDRGEDAQGHFLVMEYIDGETLHDRVAKNGALDDSAFADLARGLGKALSFAHKKSVIHRDVKPANVMFTGDGTPKLTDFGLARMGHESDLSMTGYGMGTLDYASPEQRRDAKSADHRSDIYGLGATLYFATTGESPKVVRSDRIPIRWRNVILKCLEEKPEIRYFSIDDLLRELDAARITAASLSLTSVSPGAFACSSCGHNNPEEKKYCLACGIGLFLGCPKCGEEERAGTSFCGSCGVNIPAWQGCMEYYQAARRHLESYAFGRAEKAATLALESVPGHKGATLLLRKATQIGKAVKESRVAARQQEDGERFEEAEKFWRRVLEDVPDDDEALKALAALQEKIHTRNVERAPQGIREALKLVDLDAALASFEILKAGSIDHASPELALFIEQIGELRSVQVSASIQECQVHLEGGDLSAAQECMDRARGICGKGVGLLSAETSLDGNIFAQDEALTEAREKAREKALEVSVRINPFHVEGWTVEDSTLGYGGYPQKLKDPKTGITFILVDPGVFLMGSPDSDKGRKKIETQFTVKLTTPFYLGQTEVTQGQWKKLMDSNPSYFRGDALPVEQVSWDDCQEYLQKARSDYRLPTEAEWEYACRAGTKLRFHSGNSDSHLGAVAWHAKNSKHQTHPVAKKQPNPWGFYDMHGNVREWCQDWYGIYPHRAAANPRGPSSGQRIAFTLFTKGRVLRGGSWVDGPGLCRSANRFRSKPGACNDYSGFRVARTIP